MNRVITVKRDVQAPARAEGMSASAEELIALCKARLGGVMAPKTVDFIAELPRSTAGKVLKKDLRAGYWKHIGRKI